MENAFKYSKAATGIEFIEIKIDTTNGTLFTCVNNKGALQQSDVGGIGLTNATRRLELAYPNQHTLTIEDKADQFDVSIKINS